MSKKQSFYVVIAAAGQGERFQTEDAATGPKQYVPILGKPILRHTIERFLNHPDLASLYVVIHPDHLQLYEEATSGLNLPPPIIGSNTRKTSIYNAVNKLNHLKNEDIILIHDAARPCVNRTDIDAILRQMESKKSISAAHPVAETLRRNLDPVDRTDIWAMQTPQAFHYGILKEAHEKFKKEDATDDAGLVQKLGCAPKLIQTSRENIKITYPEDLIMAEKLLRAEMMNIRTGFGYDVHAFESEENTGRPLMLGGIQIDHPYALKGHSDADVGLHAITDALLGAIGAGDIGTHFPPSNPEFKNMNSDIFLKKANELILEKSGAIQNIDLTFICEEPKIGPHTAKMKKTIAKILTLDESRISIKATTSEGLGFTGRKEGIAAQAIATILLP